MKTIGLSILFCLPFLSLAQYDVSNESLKDPSLKMAYASLDHTIIIKNYISAKPFELLSSASKITRVNDSTFILTPKFHAGIDTLGIYENEILIQQEYFRVFNPPISTIRLGQIESEYARLKVILDSPELTINPGGVYKHDESINYFQLRILDVNGEEIKSFPKTIGSKLTPVQLEFIGSLKAGTQLAFSDISVTDKVSGFVRTHRPFKIKIG